MIRETTTVGIKTLTIRTIRTLIKQRNRPGILKKQRLSRTPKTKISSLNGDWIIIDFSVWEIDLKKIHAIPVDCQVFSLNNHISFRL